MIVKPYPQRHNEFSAGIPGNSLRLTYVDEKVMLWPKRNLLDGQIKIFGLGSK